MGLDERIGPIDHPERYDRANGSDFHRPIPAERADGPVQLDVTDLALMKLLIEEPRAGMREYARVLGIARGTVQARLARLERSGAIPSYAPQLSPAALGFQVLAFIHLQLAQGHLDEVVTRLHGVAEVIEAHSTTGEGDLLCRVVAHDNAHLEQVVQVLLALPGVVRSRTEIAMKQRVAHRVLPLLQQLSVEAGVSPTGSESNRG
jgi:DNA-binding Lrp family transcriptional regulator